MTVNSKVSKTVVYQSTRVLRSSVKRPISEIQTASESKKRSILKNMPQAVIGEGGENVKTKVVKKTVVKKAVVRKTTKKDPNELNGEPADLPPISYYETLERSKEIPKLPESFKALHDPDFIKGLEFIIQQEPFFHSYIVLAPFPSFLKRPDDAEPIDSQYYFESLISSIISQQISGAAARSIKQKLIDNLSETKRLPSAEKFTLASVENLRKFGLSEKKLQYVKLIAADFTNDTLNKRVLEELSDEEIYDILINYKGIGPWSVVMFLMFSMKRLDTFTETDLGILRGASVYLNERPELLKQIKTNTVIKKKQKEMQKRDWKPVNEECVSTLSKLFQPYRSCLMMVLYRVSDVKIDALET